MCVYTSIVSACQYKLRKLSSQGEKERERCSVCVCVLCVRSCACLFVCVVHVCMRVLVGLGWGTDGTGGGVCVLVTLPSRYVGQVFQVLVLKPTILEAKESISGRQREVAVALSVPAAKGDVVER